MRKHARKGLHFVKHIHTSLVSAALKVGIQPFIDDGKRERRRCGSAAERDHVRVIMLLRQMRHLDRRAEAAANPLDLIGRDRNTDACPAANYAQIRLTRSDRLRAAFSINRIIHRFLGVRPQIQDLRSSFFQMLLDQFLQREASVV